MTTELQRRTVLCGGIAGSMLPSRPCICPIRAEPGGHPLERSAPAVPPAAGERVKGLTRWEDLDAWITPNDKFFSIAHYDRPAIDEATWRLDLAGMVAKPSTLTLNDLKALPRQEITSTVECSGNNGLPFLPSLIGNARWAGASLSEILRTAQIPNGALEVVFYGTDQGEEVVHKDTPLEIKFNGTFARRHVDRRRDESGEPAVLRDERRSVAGRQRFSGAPHRSRLVWCL